MSSSKKTDMSPEIKEVGSSGLDNRQDPTEVKPYPYNLMGETGKHPKTDKIMSKFGLHEFGTQPQDANQSDYLELVTTGRQQHEGYGLRPDKPIEHKEHMDKTTQDQHQATGQHSKVDKLMHKFGSHESGTQG